MKKISCITIIIIILGLFSLYGCNIFSLYDRKDPNSYPNSIWIVEENQHAYMEMRVTDSANIKTLLIKDELKKTYNNHFVSERVSMSEIGEGENLGVFQFNIKECKNGKFVVWINKSVFYREVFNQNITTGEKIYFTFVKQ